MSRVLLTAAALLAAGGVIYLYMRQNEGEGGAEEDQAPAEDTTIFEDAMSTVSNLTSSVADAVNDPQVQAFLWLIRVGEGTTGPNGYRTMFGGGLFSDYADHPRQVINRSGYSSSAAGAYQNITQTWDEMRTKYALPDFSPASQDIAAVGLIKRRGALGDVLAGRFRQAINKCNREWASLPGSPYGQPTLTYARAGQVLADAGATITEDVA